MTTNARPAATNAATRMTAWSLATQLGVVRLDGEASACIHKGSVASCFAVDGRSNRSGRLPRMDGHPSDDNPLVGSSVVASLARARRSLSSCLVLVLRACV